MIINNINPNKLHDELIENDIDVVFLEHDRREGEYVAENTRITFAKDTDMELVQKVIDEHDPTPLRSEPTKTEMVMLAIADLDLQREQDKIETQLAIAELAETILGGVE